MLLRSIVVFIVFSVVNSARLFSQDSLGYVDWAEGDSSLMVVYWNDGLTEEYFINSDSTIEILNEKYSLKTEVSSRCKSHKIEVTKLLRERVRDLIQDHRSYQNYFCNLTVFINSNGAIKHVLCSGNGNPAIARYKLAHELFMKACFNINYDWGLFGNSCVVYMYILW